MGGFIADGLLRTFKDSYCRSCGVPLSKNHSKDCNYLATLRAQAYPDILDANGARWEDNEITRLNRKIEQLKKE